MRERTHRSRDAAEGFSRFKSGVMVSGEDGWDPLQTCTALLELNVQYMAIPVSFYTNIIKDAESYLHLGAVVSGLDHL